MQKGLSQRNGSSDRLLLFVGYRLCRNNLVIVSRDTLFPNLVIEVWTSCILLHTALLISDGLYQQLNYSLHRVTSSAFIGTVEDLARSVTLQQILFIY